MSLFNDLVLRGLAAQRSMASLMTVSATAISTAALQGVRLTLTLPTELMAAFARGARHGLPDPATPLLPPAAPAPIDPMIAAPATVAEPEVPAAPAPAPATPAWTPQIVSGGDAPDDRGADTAAEAHPLADTDDGPLAQITPVLLGRPRAGLADDLVEMTGIGPELAATLNVIGIYHFEQIADLTPENIAWLDQKYPGFAETCDRHDLVGQAKARVWT